MNGKCKDDDSDQEPSIDGWCWTWICYFYIRYYKVLPEYLIIKDNSLMKTFDYNVISH